MTLASLADGKRQKIKKADIKERATVPSAMPPASATCSENAACAMSSSIFRL